MNEQITVTITPGFISQVQVYVSGLVNNAIQVATTTGAMPSIVVTHDDLYAVLTLPPGDIPSD